MRKPKNRHLFSSTSNHVDTISRWRVLTSHILMMALLLGGAGRVSHAQEDLLIDRHDDGYSLQWDSEDGTTSFIQHSTDLVNWQFTPHYHVGDTSARSHVLSDAQGPAVNSLNFYRLLLHPTNPNDPNDTDGDGLPNSYELESSETNPTLSDTDNDGYGDFEELYALNSDPNDWTSAFTFVDDTLDSDGDGLANYLERMIGTDPLTPGDVWEEPEPQDIDSDGDGLKDSEETTTDPSLYDTDGDGYGDGWELSYNMDPLDPMDVYDALDFWTLPEAYRLATGLDDWGDEDGDYLSNAEEFWEGTDPLLWDTDGDGVSDGEEVYFNGTDPTDGLPYYRDEDGDGLSAWEEGLLGTSDLLLDSDNDGISDFEEIKVQNVYLAQFGLPGFDPTDPLDGQADWDLDGVTNADEIAAETDYLNMDGDGDGIANFAELKLGTDPLAANDFGNSDLDGDGLSTLAERDLATNDLSIDTDGDGLSDYLEGSNESPFASYLNPLDGDDALADLDGDGLSTIYEISIMLNSGGAGSSGEADQFDPVDYHPDNLVQYNYDPHTPGDGNFDPSNEDSNGNGIPDGDDDVDVDGLSASQEYNYRTDPLKKDTDGDDVLDNEDGWARCIDLAPKRIGKRTYAIIKVKEFPETTTYVGGEINNSGHWLIKTYDEVNGQHTTPSYYYDQESVTPLPEKNLKGVNYEYDKLNDTNYFIRKGYNNASSSGQTTDDFITAALYKGVIKIRDISFSGEDLPKLYSHSLIREQRVTAVDGEGRAYAISVNSTHPVGTGLTNRGNSAAGFVHNETQSKLLGEVISAAWGKQYSGTTQILHGHTYDSSSPLEYVYKFDDNNANPREDVPITSNVKGGEFMYIHSCNAHGLCLATTANVKKAWEVRNRQDNEYIYNGTVDLKLHAWDGSGLIDLVQHDEYAYEDIKSYFLPDFIGLGQSLSALPYSSASLNNKNTILLGVDIWLDEKAGLRNDQSVDKTPTYKKITWDPKWGDQPPRNLNTQMQGYASGSSRIWQNGYWLDLEADKLLGNSDYTDIKIRDINDHGMLAAQATNAEGKKCAVFLLPVEIAPDVLAVNSDFDEGRIDPATGYAIPDCDDVPGVDRKTGAGNGSLRIDTERVHLDGLYANDERVTDDMHKGWFGVNPTQLDDDFWDGATVTINKIDKDDPDAGRKESGQVRFYAKWGHPKTGDYYGIEPYKINIGANGEVSYTANNLVTSGVNGRAGEGVYGSTSTIPEDAEFWMEGVRPGKITLEWRLQKGNIDVKHEQTFLVATEQSKQKWWEEVRYQIRLQTKVKSGSEVDMDEYHPGDGFRNITPDAPAGHHNVPRIYATYYYYQQLFKQRPEEFMWTGMAKTAGAPVIAGMSDLTTWWQATDPIPPFDDKDIGIEIVIDAFLLNGNKTIFLDMAWAHRAYIASGKWAMDYVEGIDDETTNFDAWRKINDGVLDGDVALINEGNGDILRREQEVVMQPIYFNGVANTWIKQPPLQSWVGAVAVPENANGLGNAGEWLSANSNKNPMPGGPGFRAVVPNGRIDNLNNRWAWISNGSNGMLQIWTGVASEAGAPKFDAPTRLLQNNKTITTAVTPYSIDPGGLPQE